MLSIWQHKLMHVEKASEFAACWLFHSSCSNTHWAQKHGAAFVQLCFISNSLPQDKTLLFAEAPNPYSIVLMQQFQVCLKLTLIPWESSPSPVCHTPACSLHS